MLVTSRATQNWQRIVNDLRKYHASGKALGLAQASLDRSIELDLLRHNNY